MLEGLILEDFYMFSTFGRGSPCCVMVLMCQGQTKIDRKQADPVSQDPRPLQATTTTWNDRRYKDPFHFLANFDASGVECT